MHNILILTTKSWNIENYNRYKKDNWFLITDKNELTLDNVKKINPQYILIPHWSWIIKEDIWSNYTCIVFHMTDLPFWRWWSPLQNLIAKWIKNTKISAIKIDWWIDTWDIYMKENLNLDWTADEILKIASIIVYTKMIPKILENSLVPKKQEWEIISFKRRKEEEWELKRDFSLNKIYDFIRMLDWEWYPNAFIQFGNKKITFTNAELSYWKLNANIEINLNLNEK